MRAFAALILAASMLFAALAFCGCGDTGGTGTYCTSWSYKVSSLCSDFSYVPALKKSESYYPSLDKQKISIINSCISTAQSCDSLLSACAYYMYLFM
ncbi:MAG: hypothetical protein L7F78_19010 [Syntrophales bacterium LBB04]|nr:hypothetical protein [Syntrophales bacterium LBB04]